MPKKSKKIVAAAAPAPNGAKLVGPPPVNPAASMFREMKKELEQEVRQFRDRLVLKYKSFKGHDMRKEVAWYMEQLGLGINVEMERERRAERLRLAELEAANEK